MMNWMLALPEIVLACLGMAILIFGVVRKQDSTVLATMFTIGAFLITGFLVVTRSNGVGFNGQFVTDAFASFNKELILLGGIVALILSLDWNRSQGIARFEFPVLVLFATVGMMVMVSASNLMTLYLGLELHSLALYVLAAFARDNQRSSEAGLKYFVLSGLASGLLLYGISLVYGFSGTMDFQALHGALMTPAAAPPGLIVGVVFVVVGLAFKISAVPFHMWTPDVYEGAPTPVTTFFATAPKVAAMALLLRVMGTSFAELVPAWQSLIVLMAIASMILGALAAIGQQSIKRLMAYSSIGHMGYALIGLAVGSSDGVRGVLVYMTVYVLMTGGTLACVLAMKRNDTPLEKISDLSGLATTDPGLALAISVFMFSLAGIPLMAGFFAKLYIFLAAVKAGLFALAVIGVLTSVVSAFYYIRVVKVMYFDPPVEPFDRRPPALSFVVAATGLFTAFFFLFPAPVVDAAEMASRVLFRSDIVLDTGHLHLSAFIRG
jgi:NADH-quinone oxidoreductase subunit N